MNSFSLLFLDELKGFYKSKVMVFLWVGLPLLAILLHYGSSSDLGAEIPLSLLSSLLVSSIGGTLASAMLAVSIIHEKERRTYDLFLIRPLKRWELMISKFCAVYMCVGIASVLAIMLGVSVDVIQSSLGFEAVFDMVSEPFVLSLAMTGIASAAGVLIGVVSPSVLVGVILVIYIGGNVSSLPSLPLVFGMENSTALVVFAGVIATVVLLYVSVYLFNKKQF